MTTSYTFRALFFAVSATLALAPIAVGQKLPPELQNSEMRRVRALGQHSEKYILELAISEKDGSNVKLTAVKCSFEISLEPSKKVGHVIDINPSNFEILSPGRAWSQLAPNRSAIEVVPDNIEKWQVPKKEEDRLTDVFVGLIFVDLVEYQSYHTLETGRHLQLLKLETPSTFVDYWRGQIEYENGKSPVKVTLLAIDRELVQDKRKESDIITAKPEIAYEGEFQPFVGTLVFDSESMLLRTGNIRRTTTSPINSQGHSKTRTIEVKVNRIEP